jgi:hypothetical protein
MEVVEESRGIIIPDVGQPSPIEVCEASVLEQRVVEFTGLSSRPIEKHPDGHKKDGADSNDAAWGRSMMEREGRDLARILEEAEERKRQLALSAPPVYLSGGAKPLKSTELEVDIGFRGNWQKKTISMFIEEDEFKTLASEIFGIQVATPDFMGRPYHGQQLRCYRDVSRGDDHMWITLRSRELGQSLTMRVSPDTSQECIETAASEEWVTLVTFANKFPSVLESNATYQMRRPPEDSDDQPQPLESDSEELTGLNAIAHRPAQNGNRLGDQCLQMTSRESY